MNKILVVVCVFAVGCGGDGDSIGPGMQDYEPPAMQQGSGKPSDATSVTCSQAADCGYWYCRCEDGAVVNSALCINGFCMNAAAACPDACQYFNHGAWTGEAGGGPGGTTTPPTCGGLGSDIAACDSCMHDQCCDEASSCGNSNSCLSYWDCAVDCDGDSACRAQCEDSYPSGVGPYEGLRNCLLDNCYSECVGDL